MSRTIPVVFAVVLLPILALRFLPPLTTQFQRNNQSVANSKQAFTSIRQSQQPEVPIRLVIPAIDVDVVVQQVGVTITGEMEVPTNPTEAGWFKFGTLPGEKGSAVISGHFDIENGNPGVFNNLHKLVTGDRIYVKSTRGVSTSFVVKDSRLYDPGYAEDVFSRNDGAYLNLITCNGIWDNEKKIYTKRLVVFAEATL